MQLWDQILLIFWSSTTLNTRLEKKENKHSAYNSSLWKSTAQYNTLDSKICLMFLTRSLHSVLFSFPAPRAVCTSTDHSHMSSLKQHRRQKSKQPQRKSSPKSSAAERLPVQMYPEFAKPGEVYAEVRQSVAVFLLMCIKKKKYGSSIKQAHLLFPEIALKIWPAS